MSDLKAENHTNFFNRFIFLLTLVAAIGAVICMFFISAAVGSRYILDYSIPGSLDISQIILVLIIFFPMAYVEKEGGHIKITVLYSKFPKKMVTVLNFISSTLGLILFGLMSFMSLIGAVNSFLEKEASWGDFAIPLWIPKFFIFIGATSIFIYVVINSFRKDSKGRSSNE